MTHCPSEQELRQLLEKPLDSGQCEHLADHLRKCQRCQELQERLAAESGLDSWMRQPVAIPDLPSDDRDFLARLKENPPAPPSTGSEPARGGNDEVEMPAIPGYRMLAVLGQGGMGVVYQAVEEALQRNVAIKMIKPGAVGEEILARFQVEAELVARIRHPHIVQIHQVDQFQGAPYAVLELVDGGTLARKAAHQPHPPRDAAALVEKVARAVHVAHQAGVVHRDLKPANILLTPEGDPKLTDFGLAKRLDADSSHTRAGALMGTPTYMAPEQASGQTAEVGPLADVWSLGAILYELLTGRPPFQGATVLDTLDQVRQSEPVPPRRLQPTVPPALETVCLKCLRKRPADRYASAEELADDLLRFLKNEPVWARPAGWLEKSWLWARRNPALASAVGCIVLLALVLVVGSPTAVLLYRGQRDQAVRAAEEALRQSGIAEQEASRARQGQAQLLELSGTLIFDVHDRIERLPGATPARRALVETALRHLEQASGVVGPDPEVGHKLVVAFLKLGDVQGNPGQANLNDSAGALRSYRRALELAEKASREDPDDRVAKRDVLLSRCKIGEVLQASGKLENALAAYRQALADLDELEARADRKQWLRDRAITHQRIASVQLTRGDTALALDGFATALGLFEELQNPNDPASGYDVAVAIQRLASAQRVARQTEQAAASYDRSYQIMKRLADQAPTDARILRALVISISKVGDAQEALGRQKAAETTYREGLQVALRLAKLDPDNAQAQSDLALGYARLGGCLESAGRLADALESFQAAWTIHRKLVDADPGNHGRQGDLAVADERLGTVLLRQGRRVEALTALERAWKTWADLTKAHPDNTRYRQAFAVVERRIGDVHRDNGRPDLALARYQAAATIRRELFRRDPKNAEHQRNLAMSLQTVGDIQMRLERLEEAGASYREGLDRLRELVRTDPSNWPARRELAVALERMGKWYTAKGDPERALGYYVACRDLRHQGQRDQSRAWDLRGLAVSYEKLGQTFLSLKRVSEAVECFRERVAIMRRLAGGGDDPQVQRDLGIGLQHLGDALRAAGRRDLAFRSYEESRQVSEAVAAKAFPEDHRPWRDVCVVYERLGDLYAQRGDEEKALALCQQVLTIREVLVCRSGGRDPQEVRDLATSFYGAGFVRMVLANDPRRNRRERAELWLEARGWLVKAREAYLALDERHLLPAADKGLPEGLASDIRQCDQAREALK